MEEKKRSEKIDREVNHLWSMKKVVVIPIVVEALGAVIQRIENFTQRVRVDSMVKYLQETTLLENGRILRKVVEKGPHHLISHVANSQYLRSITGYKYCATKAKTTVVVIIIIKITTTIIIIDNYNHNNSGCLIYKINKLIKKSVKH